MAAEEQRREEERKKRRWVGKLCDILFMFYLQNEMVEGE